MLFNNYKALQAPVRKGALSVQVIIVMIFLTPRGPLSSTLARCAAVKAPFWIQSPYETANATQITIYESQANYKTCIFVCRSPSDGTAPRGMSKVLVNWILLNWTQ